MVSWCSQSAQNIDDGTFVDIVGNVNICKAAASSIYKHSESHAHVGTKSHIRAKACTLGLIHTGPHSHNLLSEDRFDIAS